MRSLREKISPLYILIMIQIDNKKSELKTLKLDIKKLELNLKDMEKTENLIVKGGDFEKDPLKRTKNKI